MKQENNGHKQKAFDIAFFFHFHFFYAHSFIYILFFCLSFPAANQSICLLLFLTNLYARRRALMFFVFLFFLVGKFVGSKIIHNKQTSAIGVGFLTFERFQCFMWQFAWATLRMRNTRHNSKPTLHINKAHFKVAQRAFFYCTAKNFDAITRNIYYLSKIIVKQVF